MKKTLTEIFALLVGCQVISSSILEALWLSVSESTAATLLGDFQTQHYSTLKRGLAIAFIIEPKSGVVLAGKSLK
jgi:hypothetical protein